MTVRKRKVIMLIVQYNREISGIHAFPTYLEFYKKLIGELGYRIKERRRRTMVKQLNDGETLAFEPDPDTKYTIKVTKI
jgi:hypothetical protein